MRVNKGKRDGSIEEVYPPPQPLPQGRGTFPQSRKFQRLKWRIEEDVNVQSDISNLLPIRHHPHKPCPFYSSLQHLLMFETYASVVPFTDVAEVIDKWLHRGIILVIDVRNTLETKRTLLQSRVVASPLFGFESHTKIRE